MKKLNKAEETLSKLIELENKSPEKIIYVEGLIDGLILSGGDKSDSKNKNMDRKWTLGFSSNVWRSWYKCWRNSK